MAGQPVTLFVYKTRRHSQNPSHSPQTPPPHAPTPAEFTSSHLLGLILTHCNFNASKIRKHSRPQQNSPKGRSQRISLITALSLFHSLCPQTWRGRCGCDVRLVDCYWQVQGSGERNKWEDEAMQKPKMGDCVRTGG